MSENLPGSGPLCCTAARVKHCHLPVFGSANDVLMGSDCHLTRRIAQAQQIDNRLFRM